MKLNDIKISGFAVLGGLAIFAACATTMQADDSSMMQGCCSASSGWYLTSDAGLNMMPGIRGSSGDFRTDSGMRLTLEGGYGFKMADRLTLGLEAESGVIWNQFSAVKSDGAENELGGNFYQIPILANAVLNYHVCSKWTVYAGAGAGLDYVSANIWSHDNKSVIFAGSDFGPAAQGLAGVRYQLTAKSDLGLGYKYLIAFSEKIGGDRLSSIQNHTFSLSYTYHF